MKERTDNNNLGKGRYREKKTETNRKKEKELGTCMAWVAQLVKNKTVYFLGFFLY
jgi:hypothetical protein